MLWPPSPSSAYIRGFANCAKRTVSSARYVSHEFTADGLRVSFAADGETLASIARVVNAERLCCRFLRFVISVEPDAGPIALELSGPAGSREFIAALLDL